MGFILLIVSLILGSILLPLGFIWAVIEAFYKKGFKEGWQRANKYFRDCALSIDQTANVLCSELFNDTLIKSSGYKFGNPDETISGVLGKNKVKETLTKTGRCLDWILNKLDEDHSINSIETDENNI